MSDTSNKAINVMIFGDGTVGKTCILFTFVHGTFIEEHNQTIFDTKEVTVKVDNKSHRVRLHDTAGQEEFENLRKSFIQNKQPDVFILCYSVVNRRSYENVSNKWIQEIRNRAPIVLVATKTDLRRRFDHVSYLEGKLLQKRIGAKAFVECSSYNRTNIDDVMHEAIKATMSIPVQIQSNSSWLIVQVKKIFCC